MSFADIMAADAAFVSADVMGEPIVYTPCGAAPLNLTCVVKRDAPTAVAGTNPARFAPSIEICIPQGVGVTKIDKDGDRITVAEREGGTPTPHLIAEVVSADQGAWLLRLR